MGRPPEAEAGFGGRRSAWAENSERVRRAAGTEPGRLRIIGALLAVLVLAFGAVTAWQMNDRTVAADDVLHKSQPLSTDAADIYRSLADANTVASSGFLAGWQETAQSRQRYEDDIDTAAEKLITAANNAEPGSPSAEAITTLNKLLPEYKGLVERARTYNRQGFPVGGAYLRYANQKMQDEMLAAAQQLYTRENQRLDADYADATPYPWAALALGVVTLAALAWAGLREYRRTNRVLSPGLVAAGAATGVVLLWLAVGHTVARAQLNSSYDHGVRSLKVLHDARIASLKARGNENLTLVSRGAETIKVDGRIKDAYDSEYDDDMAALGTKLRAAAKLADDRAGLAPVTSAEQSVAQWRQRHQQARGQDLNGNYDQALALVIGPGAATGASFDNVDKSLGDALTHEQSEFKQAAKNGRAALAGLPGGSAALALLAAAATLAGIGRRLSEYR